MRRLLRWLSRFIILAVLLACGYFAARHYLVSQHVAEQVAARLEAAFGSHVEVGDADVGIMSGSTLHDLKLFESKEKSTDATAGYPPPQENKGTPAQPWAVVHEVDADVNVWSALRGLVAPRNLSLKGAMLTIKLDKDGQLLTRLPSGKGGDKTVPNVHLTEGQLRFCQEGRGDLVLHNIQADLRHVKDHLELTGSVNDPLWGRWKLSGDSEWPIHSGKIMLTTDKPIHVTQAMLDSLPLAPASTWEQVRAEGDTSAEITLRLDTEAEATPHYRVELQPTGTKVRVSSIGLNAEQAHGRVIIEDGVVRLREVAGKTADGELRTDADMDFRGAASQLQFDIRAQGLNVRDLPPQWKLPNQLEGKLRGQAKLHITVADGQAHTSGDGKGVIEEARIAGLPSDPIELRLHRDGDGFKFHTASAAPADIDFADDETPLPAPFRENVLALVAAYSSIAVQPPAAPAPPSYLEANLNLRDVDLEQLIQRMDTAMPFPVTGRASLHIQLGIPVDTPGDFKTYRFKGSVSSTKLVLADLELADVRADVDYSDGVLRLTQLHGRVPDGASGGSFDGTAKLQYLPQGDLTAQLDLARLPLQRVLSLLPSAGNVTGAVSAKITAKVPVNRLSELKALEVTGTLGSDRLEIYGVALAKPAASFRLENGILSISDVRANLYDGVVTGEASAPLGQGGDAGRVRLRFERIDTGALTKDVPAIPLRLEGRASGTWEGTVTAGAPATVTSRLDLQAPQLRVQGIPTERLHGSVNYDKGAATYDFEGESLGGRFQLQGRYPPTPGKPPPAAKPADDKNADGRLRVEGARLSRLWKSLGINTALDPLRGTADMTIHFYHAGTENKPVGSGRVVFSGLHWHDFVLPGNVLGDVRMSAEELRLADLTGSIGQGTMRGQVSVNLREFNRSWFNVSVEGVDLKQLFSPWPDVAAHLGGQAEANFRGRFGRQASGSGLVRIARGQLFGIAVSDWSIPIAWSYSAASGRGQMDITDSGAQTGNGRLTARAHLTFGESSHLEGRLTLRDAELRSLLRDSPEISSWGAGKVTGDVDFGSSDIFSANAYTAKINATLRQTQAFEFPVLRQIAPYVVPGQSATTFNSGTLRARLDRGILHIDRLGLNGANVQMLVEGTINLQGRLDLEVTAKTNQLGIDTNVLRLLNLRIPAVGPLPLTLINDVSNYLTNHVIHLRVTGTIRSPTIQIEPLRLLTEEAVRFFLNRAGVPYSSQMLE